LILLIDNFDSFTYNLADYFHQLGLNTEVRRNDVPLSKLFSEKYSGLVLSPGPGIPKNAGHLFSVLDYYSNKIPILGICLGHQAIAEYFRARLIKAQRPMHGKSSIISHNEKGIFQNLPARFSVVRYHSLVCENIVSPLEVTAISESGEVMALRHKELPIYGLQFHPEAVLTQYGLELLRNWKDINSISR
jgi:anthranilate synthase/aminodeoxychorismate synthase-like glutamine amidotransferase